MNALAKISVVIDDFIAEYQLDCITLRCWEELQPIFGIAPCVLLSELNDRGITAACEVDLCSAINMYSMQLASQTPATCLDWNNNYGSDPDKVILFHCGPVPQWKRERLPTIRCLPKPAPAADGVAMKAASPRLILPIPTAKPKTAS